MSATTRVGRILKRKHWRGVSGICAPGVARNGVPRFFICSRITLGFIRDVLPCGRCFRIRGKFVANAFDLREQFGGLHDNVADVA